MLVLLIFIELFPQTMEVEPRLPCPAVRPSLRHILVDLLWCRRDQLPLPALCLQHPGLEPAWQNHRGDAGPGPPPGSHPLWLVPLGQGKDSLQKEVEKGNR